MVHKKYIRRGGKLYGPYFYESYREGNKVKKRYFSAEEYNLLQSQNKTNIFDNLSRVKPIFYLIPLMIIVFVAATMLLYNAQPTGKIGFAMETQYNEGEPLSGFLRFNIKQGELVPKNSKVIVNLGTETKEYSFSELAFSTPVSSGNFFVEGSSISGSGEGYGLIGSRVVYPVIDFELKIFNSVSGGENPQNPPESSPEFPAESSGGSEKTGVSLTTSVISQNEIIVSGQASRENNFVYKLEDGQSAELVSGSVRINGEAVGDEKILLQTSENEAIISTSYSITDQGFGEEFLGAESITVSIAISEFGLVAQAGQLSAKLIYEDATLAEASKEIFVIPSKPEENASAGAGEANGTISNLTAVKIATSRTAIRLGRPVKWTKNVSLEIPENITVEIPASAENITVKKIIEDRAEEIKVKQNIVTGAVTARIELEKEPRFISWLRKLFARLTGRAIEGANETNGSISIELTLAENATNYIVEYYTEAPTSTEEETSYGKKVVISGPDDLGYADILSFVNVSEKINVDSKGSIRIYWVENKTNVPFEAYDTNGNGLIDYVEWITPHLSNQTFEIILISKAEHLDENKIFLEDVYDKVSARDDNWAEIPDSHYLRVVFEHELDSSRDITIYARSNYSNADVEVYEKDGMDKIADFGAISEDKEYKVYLANLSGLQDTFDLKVSGGTEFDYVVDPDIADCGDISASSTLTADVFANRTCFNITANDVILDCKGYTINYDVNGSSNAFGVLAKGVNNITIKNCIIKDINRSGAASYGINFSRVNNSLIFNNSIFTNGTSSNIGISLFGNSSGTAVENNTIFTWGTSSFNYGIEIDNRVYDVRITNNNINATSNGSAGTSNYGIYITTFGHRYNITNNRIFTNGSATNHGIYFSSSGHNSTITNNNITISSRAGASNSYGIYMFGVDNVNVSNNLVNVNGTTGNVGIYLNGAVNDSCTFNTIIMRGSTGTNYGIEVSGVGAQNNTISGNIVMTNNSFGASNIGIYLDTDARYNLVADNVITTGGTSSSTNYGIYLFTRVNNTNVRNNTISTGGTSNLNYGIYLYTTVAQNNITGNIIATNGTGNDIGIMLSTAAKNNTVTFNKITTQGSAGGSNLGIEITAAGSENNTISYNNISTNGSGTSNHGIYVVTSVKSNTIVGNNITAWGTEGNYGVYLSGSNPNNSIMFNIITTNGWGGGTNYGISSSYDNNTFSGNIINTAGNGLNNIGINLGSPGWNNIIYNNTITTQGNSSNSGVYISDRNNSITSNKITTQGMIGGNNHGIVISSLNNTVSDNVIITNGSGAGNRGISLSSANNNIFKNNNITTKTNGSYGILMINSNNSIFINTILSNTSEWISISGAGYLANFTNTTFLADNGKVVFADTFWTNGTTAVNRTGLRYGLNISFNKVYLNSSNLTFLNRSAEITLNGLSFANPQPIVSYNNTESYYICPAPQCINLSYNSGTGTFVFNVSSFTTYSSMENSSLNVTIIGPANGTVLNYSTVNFTINASSSSGLANATLNIYNLTGLYNQTTVNLGGIVQATVSISVWLADGIYSWFWEVFDLANNFINTGMREGYNRTLQVNTTFMLSQCGTLSEANGLYILTQDIFSSGSPCIIITSPGTTVDCRGYKVIGTSAIDCVYLSQQPSITIRNCHIRNCDSGIHVDNTYGHLFTNNTITNNTNGVIISSVNLGVSIIGNNISLNTNDGIEILTGAGHTISNNIVANNSGTGIYVLQSSTTRIINNSVSRNYNGITINDAGSCIYNGKEVSGNNVSYNANYGLLIGGCNTLFANNSATFSRYDGAYVSGGFFNNFTNNNFSSNNQYGIRLPSAQNNIFTGDTVQNNSVWDVYSDTIGNSLNNTFINMRSYQNTLSFILHGVALKGERPGTIPIADPTGKKNISRWVNATNINFMQDDGILLNISYSNADIAGINESSLRVWRYNAFASSNWQIISEQPYGVDIVNNYVYANLSNFSTFGVFGDELPISCGDVSLSITLMNNVTSTGTCFNVIANNVTIDCNGSTINYNSDGSDNANGVVATSLNNVTVKNCLIRDINESGAHGYAINFTAVNNSLIQNNTIYTNGTNNNYGISIQINSVNNTISNNVIRTMGSSTFNEGIYLYNNVLGTNVTNNDITTNGSNRNYGIFLDPGVNNSIINGNIIRAGGSGNRNRGIGMSGAYWNNFTNNSIITSGTDLNHGVWISGSAGNNLFRNGQIYTSGDASYGIYLESGASSNIFNGTILNRTVGWIYSDSASLNNNLTNTTFMALNGSVRFPGLFQVNGEQDVNTSRFNITYNRIYLNSSNLTFMNRSAEITLTGLSFANPQPIVDFNDSGIYSVCSSPRCINLGYNGGTFVFNVSSFTGYSSSENYALLVVFGPPTPANATVTSLMRTQMNVTVSNATSLNSFIWNWNGTNYTIYNGSLILMYNFENKSLFGESATKVVDMSNSSYNATCSGTACPNWTANGLYGLGGAYVFDGINDSFDLGNVLGFERTDRFSITAWIKVANQSSYSNGGVILAKMGGYPLFRGYDFIILQNSLRVYIDNDFTGGNALAVTEKVAGKTTDNKWHFVTMTYDGSSSASGVNLYVDGVASAKTILNNGLTGTILSANTTRVGQRSGDNAFPFNGTMDELRVWNRTLSADEIKELYYANLRKIDVDKWELYVNQSGYGNGTYTYQAFASQNATRFGQTEQRILYVNMDACRIITSTTTMIGGAVSNETCFTINADNLVFDCAGYPVYYDTSGIDSRYAFDISHRKNVTVKNCITQKGANAGSHGYGINALNSTELILVNNSISTMGDNNNYGLSLRGSANNTVVNNSISTSGGMNNHGIYLGPLNGTTQLVSYSNPWGWDYNSQCLDAPNINFCQVCDLNGLGDLACVWHVGMHHGCHVIGKWFQGALILNFTESNTVNQGTIETVGGEDYYCDLNGHRIFYAYSANNCGGQRRYTIPGNYFNDTEDNILVCAASGSGKERYQGFRLLAFSYVNPIGFSTGNLIDNNVISSYGNGINANGSTSHGVRIEIDSDANNISNNNIIASGLYSDGISVLSASSNKFVNNSISYEGSGVKLTSALANIFNNSYIAGNSSLYISESYGDIIYSRPINISTQINLSQVVSVSFNATFVNTTDIVGNQLNKSAQLIIRNLQFYAARPVVDVDDNNSYAVCGSQRCTNVNYTKGSGLYVFNVSSFTTYAAQEATACQDIDDNGTFVFKNDVYYTDADGPYCFQVFEDNVTMDCAGYKLIGNGRGIGIIVNTTMNTIIQNCYISNFTMGVASYNSLSHLITNVTLDKTLFSINWSYVYYSTINNVYLANDSRNYSALMGGRGIYLSSSDRNLINNITVLFNSSQTGGTLYSYGIIIGDGSDYNNLTNLRIYNLSGDVGSGVYIGSSSSNNVVFNATFGKQPSSGSTPIGIWVDSAAGSGNKLYYIQTDTSAQQWLHPVIRIDGNDVEVANVSNIYAYSAIGTGANPKRIIMHDISLLPWYGNGGIYVLGGSTGFQDSIFYNIIAMATAGGGPIIALYHNDSVYNCTFYSYSGGSGQGVSFGGENSSIVNSTFYNMYMAKAVSYSGSPKNSLVANNVFRDITGSSYSLMYLAGGSQWYIENNTFRNISMGTTQGAIMLQVANNTVRGNTFTNISGGSAIYLGGSAANCLILNNTIVNVTWPYTTDRYANGVGISIILSEGNNTIANNTIINTQNAGISSSAFMSSGMILDKISENNIYNSRHGLYYGRNSHTLQAREIFTNNLIVNASSSGILAEGGLNVTFANNTIINSPAGINLSSQAGFFGPCCASHYSYRFENNTFVNVSTAAYIEGLGQTGGNEWAANDIALIGNNFINSTNGITLNRVNRSMIVNNTLMNSNVSVGISATNLTDSLISRNNLNISQHGIILATNSRNNTVDNNNISSANSVVEGLVISTSSTGNTLSNNTINLTGSRSSGVEISNSSGTIIYNNNFAGFTLYAINLINSLGTVINNSYLPIGVGSLAVNESNGSVIFTQPINFSISTNLSQVMSITFNKTFVNSSNVALGGNQLNLSAQISMFGIDMSYPRPFIDVNDAGTFVQCTSPQCIRISYAALSNIFVFNVSSFTTYAVQDLPDTPNIAFVAPTPANVTRVKIVNTGAIVNVTITNATVFRSFIWNWNGTNYTVYNDSLVLMMGFDNLSTLGESPTYMADASKYNNSGSCTGVSCPTWNATGKYGGAYRFDGANDWINITQRTNLDVATFTISLWLKPNMTTNDAMFFYNANLVSGWEGWGIGMDKNTLACGTGDICLWLSRPGGYYEYVDYVYDFPVNNWTYWTVTYNNATRNATFFINGVQAYSRIANYYPAFPAGAINTYIGSSAGSAVFNGTIDELRVWNRVLGDNEIRQSYIYNLQKYDSDKWLFYANESNLTANYNYTYQAGVYASATVGNQTEQRQFMIDTLAPNVTILGPANGTITNETTMNFTINASDVGGLANATLYIYNLTGLYNQTTIDLTGVFQTTVGIVVTLVDGVYNWFWEVFDLATNFVNTGVQEGYNRTLTINTAPPGIAFVSPTLPNNAATDNRSVDVNITITNLIFNDLGSFILNWNGTNYTIYNDSLVLMYNFDNVSSLGENATRIVDVSRYGNNGTCSGATCPNWTSSGKYGGAYSFDGYDDYIATSSLAFTNFTAIMWLRTVNAIDNDQYIWGKISSVYARLGGVCTAGRIDYGVVNASDWTNFLCSNAALSDNTWVFVAFTFDTQTISLYVNGVLDLNRTYIGIPQDSGAFELGTVPWALGYTGSSWNGSVDEARLYNRALSAAEIYEQYVSNLNKHAPDKWSFQINQSKNATTMLDFGTYTYQAFASASNGANQTEQRTITIAGTDISGCINITSPGAYNLVNSLSSIGTCINVNAGNVSLNCSGYTIQGSGTGAGINVTSVSNVTIKNCIIRNFNHGIKITDSSNNLLINNTHTNNTIGMYLELNNTLVWNSTFSNSIEGVILSSSGNNTLRNNRIFNTTNTGITINGTSTANIIFNSTVTNYTRGILLMGAGVSATNVNNNTITNLNNRPIAGQAVVLFNSSNNTISTNGISNSALNSVSFNIAINLTFSHNNTIFNNSISASGDTGNDAVYLIASSNNLINNNSLTVEGGSNDYGAAVNIISGSFNQIANNSISASGQYGGGYLIVITANTSLMNNRISTTCGTGIGSCTIRAIYGLGSAITVFNNNISMACSTGTCYLTGIYLNSGRDSNITFNKVVMTGVGGDYIGVDLDSFANANLTGNNLTVRGTGILLEGVGSGSSNNTIISNRINATSYGLSLTSRSSGNVMGQNTISVNGTSLNSVSSGISLSTSSNRNNFTFNYITTQGDRSYAISISRSNDSSFIGNVFYETAQWIISDIAAFRNNFTNTTFATVNGSIRMPGLFELNNSQNITRQKLNISLNRAFLNSTNLTFMNRSAEIILYGINMTNPQPFVDFADSGSFVRCSSPQCDIVNYSNSTLIFVFNVSSFTAYRAQDVPNTAPNRTVPILYTASGLNRTAEDLLCNSTLTDLESNLINVTVRWYNNSGLAVTQNYNNNYANGTIFQATLGNSVTAKGQTWNCSVNVSDGVDSSGFADSNNLLILNTPPTISLTAPNDGNATTNRTPTFSWTGNDDDLDSLTYEFNISLVASSLCTEADRYVNTGGTASYTPTSDLKCLYDHGDYYIWSARAYDGNAYSGWATYRKINITALVSISTPTDTINFGSIAYLSSKNTSEGSPAPFTVQNDGNVLVNITAGATNLWNAAANPSIYYQFKARESGEAGSFNVGNSTTTYTNVPVTGSPLMCIAELKYPDATDSSYADIYVRVPVDEGSGARSSVMTFTASLAE